MSARYLISALSLFVLGKALQFIFKTRRDKSSEPQESKCTNQVLFFPDENFPCPRLVSAIGKSSNDCDYLKRCLNPSCSKLHNRPGEKPSSLIKFLEHLASAKRQIDVCIYLFTHGTLSDLLLGLRRRTGLEIRIITDSTEDESRASQIRRLRADGIVIKSNRRGTGALMHHKFVIIDNKTLLTGSFNWTNKAVVSNHEAVIISSDPALVKPFSNEFAALWAKFDLHPTGVSNH